MYINNTCIQPQTHTYYFTLTCTHHAYIHIYYVMD